MFLLKDFSHVIVGSFMNAQVDSYMFKYFRYIGRGYTGWNIPVLSLSALPTPAIKTFLPFTS